MQMAVLFMIAIVLLLIGAVIAGLLGVSFFIKVALSNKDIPGLILGVAGVVCFFSAGGILFGVLFALLSL